jgi:hypothetical protein
MMKHRYVFIGLFLALLLWGCRATPSPTTMAPTSPAPSPPTSQYLTALEAYVEIQPTMQDWHADAFVSDIYSSKSKQSENRVRADGKARVWNFAVYSPEAQKRTEIAWTNGEIKLGISDAPDGEWPSSDGTLLPVERMNDSDQAVKIALQNSASVNDTLYHITIRGYDVPLSWALTYGHLYDFSQQKVVMVDILTGEIWRDDFNPPLPTPTVDRPPSPDQLTLYMYGTYDLLITNAQGLSLGVEPETGNIITEIPDAWQSLDTEILTEDNIRVAATLLMNPLAGRYRIQLHGPGEPEKQCRLAVEMRLGTGEKTRREVDIACQEGVSVTYNFTVSLTGEALLSELIQE